jgi:hypothetical protein
MARGADFELPDPIFHEPIFGEADKLPSPNVFATEHPGDDELYRQVKDLLTKDVVAIPPSRAAPDAVFPLAEAYGSHGPQVTRMIEDAGKIIFHALGDSGASDVRKYSDELRVADQVTLDANSASNGNRPAFLFHLGDIIYSFGEAQYYYDQFYEPFRNYPAPIFAIPGNHDSFIRPGIPEGQEPLTTFQRNFCSPERIITSEAGSLHRTAMVQPGVYFALDAPFVRIIGLFSNALEDPGVISNQDGNWSNVSNVQIDFLRAQLRKIRTDNYPGAVLIATHHPPFSYAPQSADGGSGGNHASSTAMLQQIDRICHDEGVYPHAFLSAHSHNYQRFTRVITFGGKEIDVPFIVCGDGGHNVNPLVRAAQGEHPEEPNAGTDVRYLEGRRPPEFVKQLLLEKYDDQNYGYLRIHIDRDHLRIGFHQVGVRTLAQSRYDMVTVDLAAHEMVAN